MNDDLPDLKEKNYSQQQFEKRCLKQFTNFATGYDPLHNRNFLKWLVNKINAEFVLFTLSGCSNPGEVKIFGLLPTSSYQPYTIATFKATSRLLIYIKTIKNLKQSAKYVHDGVPDIFWHSGLNPNKGKGPATNSDDFLEKAKRGGGGGFFNPKLYVADFGNLKQGFFIVAKGVKISTDQFSPPKN